MLKLIKVKQLFKVTSLFCFSDFKQANRRRETRASTIQPGQLHKALIFNISVLRNYSDHGIGESNVLPLQGYEYTEDPSGFPAVTLITELRSRFLYYASTCSLIMDHRSKVKTFTKNYVFFKYIITEHVLKTNSGSSIDLLRDVLVFLQKQRRHPPFL